MDDLFEIVAHELIDAGVLVERDATGLLEQVVVD